MTKAALILFAAAGAFAQTFEVASIKPASFPSDGFFQGFTYASGCTKPRVTIARNRVVIEKVNACGLLRAAYDVEDFRIASVPQWILGKDRSTYYDIQAQAADGMPLTEESARSMLQALLAERFHLRFHREQRETPVYALVVGKNGHKLSTEPLKTCDGPIPKLEMRGQGGGNCQPKLTMTQLAYELSHVADRPVIDRTGLTGKFAYFLVYTPENAATQANSAPELFTAIQEQLGLKLEPTKAPFDVLVIDQLERPTEN